MPASVAPRCTAAPVRPRCPQPGTCFWLLKRADVRARAAKMCGVHGRAQKVCCLIDTLSMQPCIESGTLSLRKRASRTVKVFSGFMHSSAVFRGCSPQQIPRQMRAVAQKIWCSVRHNLCCTLAGGFRTHACLKSTCTDFVGGGLVQAVLERPRGRW